jgi:hypothetical protein
VVGQAETKKVIEGAWRRRRSWRVGRPKPGPTGASRGQPGPASKAVRKGGGPFGELTGTIERKEVARRWLGERALYR